VYCDKVRFSVANKPKALSAASGDCDIFDVGGAPTGHKNATTTALHVHNSGHKTGQKWHIGFEASCEVVSVARSPRSALMCVSRHRSQRGRIVRRIGSEVPFLVGHPGLEPGANGLRTHLKCLKTLNFSTIPRAT
jgi:hypothetical protein